MSVSPFPTVRGGAEELHTGPGYRYDNAARPDPDVLVVQRTLAGAGFFEDAAGRRLVPAGQAMVFSHREDSRYGYPPEATEPYRLRFLAFGGAASVRPVFEALRREFGPVVHMPAGCEATAVFEEILDHLRGRSFRDRLHEAELVHRLLVALYREQVAGTRWTDPIEFGHHYLRDHFRSPINLKAVVARCGVTREHFIRRFAERFGEPPGALLRRLRLEHARAMLVATEIPVEEVALACGFAGSNAFCRAYRQAYGRSPGRERTRADST
jgi:AraC-like DNA-binding protein